MRTSSDTQIEKKEILSFKLKTANMGSDALTKKYGVNMVLIWAFDKHKWS